MLTRDFLTAGRALFTVSNPAGERYTFRISRKDNDGRPPVYFVSLLTGPDNETSYTYLGLLNAANGDVRLTAKSRYNEDTKPVKVVRWFLAVVYGSGRLPTGYKAHHEGKCGRCGRTLTVPESVESGIGPECAKVMGRPRVAATRPAPCRRDESGFISDGADIRGLAPQRDGDGEVTHWTGYRDGRSVTVWND